jgi:hypothetical protein
MDVHLPSGTIGQSENRSSPVRAPVLKNQMKTANRKNSKGTPSNGHELNDNYKPVNEVIQATLYMTPCTRQNEMGGAMYTSCTQLIMFPVL